jgi:hypothetical protein
VTINVPLECKIKEKQMQIGKCKIGLKTIPWPITRAQRGGKKSFQHIRLRMGISHASAVELKKADDWAGGHYFSTGKYSGLVFNDRIVTSRGATHTHCNKFLW